MKLKPCILSLCLFLIISNLRAQNSGVILRGGLNLANITVSENGKIDDSKMLASFQAGFIGDVAITKSFAFQPGLLVTGKGSKTEAGKPTDANYFKATTNPIYLEVPLNLVYKFGISEGPNFFVGAGPYLAIGIAGKNKVEGKFLGSSFSSKENIKWSDDDPTTMSYEEGAGFGIMKRFDYGLNGTAGIDLSKVVLSVNYGWGLAKLQSGTTSSDDDDNKHRVLSFAVGFRL